MREAYHCDGHEEALAVHLALTLWRQGVAREASLDGAACFGADLVLCVRGWVGGGVNCALFEEWTSKPHPAQ